MMVARKQIPVYFFLPFLVEAAGCAVVALFFVHTVQNQTFGVGCLSPTHARWNYRRVCG